MPTPPPLDTQTPFGIRKFDLWSRLVWAFCDWKPWGPARRRWLRKRFARRLPGPFDVHHETLKLRLYPAENHCDRVICSRKTLPEAKEHRAILPHLKARCAPRLAPDTGSTMVFVDIGANVGTYTIFAGRHGADNITLLAFEPHPRTFEKLLFNVTANGLPTQHILNCGVAGEETSLSLWSDGGSNIGQTSMLKAGTSNPKHAVTVPVRPLLNVLAERAIAHIDVLKIDIEGFEDRALGPFLSTADDALLPTAILMEMEHQHLWEIDIATQLREKGYRENKITPLNSLFTRDV
ncbi:MAG: FkbM family methyltransferase [Pseudomonadota bacterium]